MSVLVLGEIEAEGGALRLDATARVVAATASLGDVVVLVVGGSAAVAAAEAATIQGVSRVLLAEGPPYAHRLAEPVAKLIARLAQDFDHVAAAASSESKNILPRAAALLDVMVIPDVIGIKDAETFDRPTYAGNAVQTVRSADRVKVFTLRTSAFAAAATGGAATVAAVSNDAVVSGASRWVEDKVASSDRPELTSARIVVSGGRGVGSEANFGLISALADKLGAAMGASRAAVDSGYAPNDLQVGQTGKVVAPELYIAVGISGAIQHLAGMKDSKVIVAINKDEEAPIFQVADYGLVGDLFTVVPELTDKL